MLFEAVIIIPRRACTTQHNTTAKAFTGFHAESPHPEFPDLVNENGERRVKWRLKMKAGGAKAVVNGPWYIAYIVLSLSRVASPRTGDSGEHE